LGCSINYCNGIDFYQAVSSGASAVVTSNYVIEQQGSTLVTKYNGANVATLTSTGVSTATTSNATTFNGTTANVTTFNGTTANVTTLNATTANATNHTGTNFSTANFTITESGGVLQFKYGATVVMSMDATGNLISATNITAYGTP
jgi:L-lactate utilization protein LutC